MKQILVYLPLCARVYRRKWLDQVYFPKAAVIVIDFGSISTNGANVVT